MKRLLKRELIITFVLIILLIGISYAFFSSKISFLGSHNTSSLGIENLSYTFESGSSINLAKAEPGDYQEKTFTLLNTGDSDISYNLVWRKVENEYVNQSDIVYILTCVASSGTCNGKTEAVVPDTGTFISILSNQTIAPDVTYTYTITVTFKETNIDQSANMNKILSAEIGIIANQSKTITGEYATLSDSIGSPLKNYEIYGNTVTESLLPSEYQQVEYLQSSGTQYIDTGVVSADDIGISAIFSALNNADTIVVGSKGTLNSRLAVNTTTKVNLSWNGYYSTGVSNVVNNKYNVSLNYLNDRQRIVNGATYASITATLVSDNTFNLYMFAGAWTSNTPSLFFSGKIYNVKISQGSNVIRDFIPCYRVSDNVAGMYDLVNGLFYTNAGTGTFTLGANTPIEVISLGETSKNIISASDFINIGSVRKFLDLYLEAGDYAYSSNMHSVSGLTFYTGIVTNDTYEFTNPIKTFSGFGETTDSGTFTITTAGTYRFLIYCVNTTAINTLNSVWENVWTQIEKGTTITDYMPKNYVETKNIGKNLFDKNTALDNTALYYGDTISNSQFFTTDYIDIRDVDVVSINKAGSFGWYNSSYDIISSENKSFTIFRNYVKPAGAVYLRITCSKADITMDDLMIVSGSYMEATMPAYQEPIINIIDLAGHEPLRKLPNGTSDYIDYQSGKIIRKVKKVVFTGEESFTLRDASTFGVVYDSYVPNGKNNLWDTTNSYCTHALLQTYVNISWYSTPSNNQIEFRKITENWGVAEYTVTAWKAFLTQQYEAGTPVTIYYELATAIEENIDLPIIDTLPGRNVVSARDGRMLSSNLNITYYYGE